MNKASGEHKSEMDSEGLIIVMAKTSTSQEMVLWAESWSPKDLHVLILEPVNVFPYMAKGTLQM